jgi:hypothetical protein
MEYGSFILQVRSGGKTQTQGTEVELKRFLYSSVEVGSLDLPLEYSPVCLKGCVFRYGGPGSRGMDV